MVCCGAILCSACRSDKQPQASVPPVKVEVMKVGAGNYATSRHFSGTVEEENGTSLSFSVAGTVKKLHIRLGQQVSAGQLLAELDPTSMQSSYEAAKATRSQAEDAYRRMEELHRKGSLPEIKWVEVQTKLQQARSMEEIARKNLGDCRLYAPYSGLVAEKNLEVGQNVLPGVSVAKLVSSVPTTVKIAVPETEISAVRVGQKGTLGVPALGGGTFPCTVAERGVVANPLSRSYEVKVRVDSPVAGLMSGMVAQVSLQPDSAASARIVLPAPLVQLDEHNRSFVWVANAGKAEKRVVQCGEYTADGVVLLGGLQPGETVIVEGRQKVCNGTPLSTANE